MKYLASHSVLCNAPAAQVYQIIRLSSNWPQVFEPCEAVTVLERTEEFERIEITARVNGIPMTWQSQRQFLQDCLGIESTLLKTMPLVAAMRTSWRVIAINSAQSLLLLEHAYDLCREIAGQVEGVSTLAQAEEFIARAIDNNSNTELGNIKCAVEAGKGQPSSTLEHSASHSVVCNAPVAKVYDIIRNVDHWPRMFDACVSAKRLRLSDGGELVRIEAEQDGHLVAWETQRRYYETIHRIDYTLPVPMPFLASMQGQWRVVALDSERCLLTVQRQWRLLDDISGIREGVTSVVQAAQIVAGFVAENAQAEMQAIRAYVEGRDEAHLAFTSRSFLPLPASEVYAVLANATLWPQVLPHCEALEMLYDDGRYQEMLMHVQTPRGKEVFRSMRHCDAEQLTISYFQPKPPAVLKSHHGSWQVLATAGGCEVLSHHTVVLDSAACASAFGNLDKKMHKRRVKELISANSHATVLACQNWLSGKAEQQVAA